MSTRERFDSKVRELMEKKRGDNNFTFTRERYNELLASVKYIKIKQRKEPGDYRKLARYDVLVEGGQEKLIRPRKGADSDIVYYVVNDEIFDILHETHVRIGHGGRNRMTKELKNKYANITKQVVMVYLALCKRCCEKKPRSKQLILKPTSKEIFNLCGQLDFIDMESRPCQDYRYIMVYQDYSTKFILLKALQTTTAEDVAQNLLDIFTTIGIPAVLESDTKLEFSNSIIEELHSLWKEIKLVQGQLQEDSMEKTNQSIHKMLSTWMADNDTTNWVTGLKIVQFMKNRSYHDSIKTTPYEAMFACPARMGMLPLSNEVKLETEEDIGFEDFGSSSFSTKMDHEEIQEDIEISVVKEENCVVCEKPFSSIQFCLKCGEPVHSNCGAFSKEQEGLDNKILCPLCFPKRECLE